MSTPRHVAIYVFNDVELLDFAGPFEVFSVAARRVEPKPFEVFLVAEESGPVHTSNGLTIVPPYSFADSPKPDLLVIPGGIGSRKAMNDENVLDWVIDNAACAELVLSVCTGSLILAKAKLLDGLDVTTHFQAIDLLKSVAPNSTVHEGKRFIDNGQVITSAGVASGMDMSLHVLAKLLGKETALDTARYIEYPWQVDDESLTIT